MFTFSKNKLKFENQVSAVNKPLIFGTQTGEYFGASLAAGDFNNDGLDDLIVGAPYRKNDKTGFNHGSVYVFYGQAVSYHNFVTVPIEYLDSNIFSNNLL